MQEIQSQYEGTSEGARRKQFIRADINKILYKSETTFIFEKYFTNFKGIFNVLEKYGVPLYKEQMVERLLDHIITPNTELKTEGNIFRSLQFSTFVKAYTYLYTVVTRLYSYANPYSGHFRKHSIYAAIRGDHGEGRGECFNLRGRER